MHITVGERWEVFIERIVLAGRYGSASEVVREGLRLVEEREARLLALRETLNASIAAGGIVSEDDIDAALAAKSAELEAQGYGVWPPRRPTCSTSSSKSPKAAEASP